MTQELKEEMITLFEYFATQKGKVVRIETCLCTNKDNYNRHFTTFSKMEFELTHFCVRISGGRAMFQGKNQSYEIGGDLIIQLEKKEQDIYELTEKYSENIYRKSILSFS